MFNVHFLISETFRDLPRISRTFGIFWFLRKNDSMTRMTPGSSAVRRFLVLASSSSIRIRIFQRVEFSSNFKIQIQILNNKNHQKNLDFSCPISKNRISRQISKKSNFPVKFPKNRIFSVFQKLNFRQQCHTREIQPVRQIFSNFF